MKFTSEQIHLDRGFSVVSHAIPNKPTRPIQGYVLATTDGERVRLSAMKEDIGIHCWIPTSRIDQEGTMLLPARLATDFVGNLPSAPVTITFPSPKDAAACNVACLRSSADMKNAAEDPAEFPLIPSFADGGEHLLLLDAELLKQIIRQVAFAAASEDDARPALTGLHIEISNGHAVFAAADTFRLASRTILIPDNQLRCHLLVPARTMVKLAKILPYHGTVQVMLTASRNQVLFHTDSIDLSSRLLNENFPNFRNAIPKTYTTRAIMRTQELASAIRLLLPFANVGQHMVRLKLYGEDGESFDIDREPNTIKLEAVAQDVGTNENVVNARVEGPDQIIILNVSFLSDVLAAIEEPEVALEISNPRTPVSIKPVGPLEYVHVVMPMNEPQANTVQVRAQQNHTNQVAVPAAP